MAVNSSECFEAHLAERIAEYRGSNVISDMLFYHYGYGVHAPARTGKRLRPQMVMRTALSEGAALDACLDAAAAIEILHNYSLVHDDIEDRDELRHGRQTLWSKYGIAPAIDAGNAMCALSFLTLARGQSHHPPKRVLAMVDALQHAHRVMCDGQALDLEFESAAMVDLARYERMIAGKTAALFEAACVLGAHCAHADETATQRYAQAGRAYGMAFQIRDDFLGIWGSAQQTGKVPAHDLARRKWTYPVVWAVAQPPSPARDVIVQAYGAGEPLDQRSVSDVTEALEALGAREAATRGVAEAMALVEGLTDSALREFLLETLAATVG